MSSEPDPPAEDLQLRPTGPERRTAARLGGNPVVVLLADDAPGAEPFPGVVLDRSPSGLGLSVERGVRPGKVLRVRPADAPDDVPWLPVKVRHCAAAGGAFWELGCQFLEPLPWEVLQLFG